MNTTLWVMSPSYKFLEIGIPPIFSQGQASGPLNCTFDRPTIKRKWLVAHLIQESLKWMESQILTEIDVSCSPRYRRYGWWNKIKHLVIWWISHELQCVNLFSSFIIIPAGAKLCPFHGHGFLCRNGLYRMRVLGSLQDLTVFALSITRITPPLPAQCQCLNSVPSQIVETQSTSGATRKPSKARLPGRRFMTNCKVFSP